MQQETHNWNNLDKFESHQALAKSITITSYWTLFCILNFMSQTKNYSINRVSQLRFSRKPCCSGLLDIVQQPGYRSVHFIYFVGRELHGQSWREWYPDDL